MNPNKRTLASVLLLLAALILCSCSGKKQVAADSGTAAVTELVVKAQPVQRGEWLVSVPISGNLRSQSTVEVRCEVGGRLVSAYFREGDLVRRNDLLAEIDPANYQLAYNQAAAAVSVAEAGMARAQVLADHARREKERADNLVRTGGITEKDHQAAATGVKEAETQVRLTAAQVEHARSLLSIAEKALKDCRILAPAEGLVQKRFYDQGTLLSPGSSLYTLVDNARLELECLLPSYRLAEIRTGQQAYFTTPTWGGRKFECVVSALNPVVESDNRSIKVVLRMANAGGALRAGMYARGEITIRREHGALIIPRTALMAAQDESGAGQVFVVTEGRAGRRDVQIGSIQQDRVWVRQGLREGEVVVVEVGPSLKEGLAVRVAPKNGAQGS